MNRTVWVFATLLLWSLLGQAEERKNVLVISAYHPAFPTFYQQVEGVTRGLKDFGFDRTNMNLDYEYMDSKRFNSDTNTENFVASLSHKMANLDRPYDVVLVADDNALDLALAHKDDLFINTPVVFFGVNDINKAVLLDSNPQFTGVVEAISIEDTFDLISQVHGNDVRLQIIVDGTPSGQGDLKSLMAYHFSLNQFQIEVLDLSRITYEQLAVSLKSNSDQATLLLSGFRDVSGEYKDFHKLVSFLNDHSRSPIYHFWRHGVGDGLLGGKVVSHYEQGRVAASMAGRILTGSLVSQLPVLGKSPNVFMFDYEELSRYDISVELLPDNAFILNKPLTFREENPRAYWAMLGGFIIGLVIIIALIIMMMMRRKMSRQLEEAYIQKSDDLDRTHKDLVQSEKMAALGRLVAGVAHEINTPIGVGVTVGSQMQQLIKEMDAAYQSGDLSKKQMDAFIRNYSEGSDILMSSLQGAAKMISSFKQVAVDQSGEQCREINVKDYLNSIVLSLKPEMKMNRVEVQVQGADNVQINTFPGAFSQVITNLMMNSVIHGFEGKSFDSHIDMAFKAVDGGLELTYQDNGKGMDDTTCQKVFDPFFTTKMGEGGSGLGMNIVYNLVINQLKGNIRCDSAPGKGVTFVVTIAHLPPQLDVESTGMNEPVRSTRVLH